MKPWERLVLSHPGAAERVARKVQDLRAEQFGRRSGHLSRESFTVTIETSEPPERARLEIERALRYLWADVLVKKA